MAEEESGFGSSEGYGDEMEVDSAITAASPNPYLACTTSVAQQCTEGAEAEGTSPMPTLLNRTNYRLCVYDNNLQRHFHQPKRLSLSEHVSSTMNCLKRYEVSEPIGCALLLSSDGTPGFPNDLTSVEKDVDTIAKALQMGGWDVICQTSKLRSGTLLEYLTALGKENQLRYLGLQMRDLMDYSVFMLYYTGHGTAEGVVLNDGVLVPYQEIVTKVADIPCFSKKPKLFLFDSCRKKKMDQTELAGFVAPKNHFSKDLQLHHERLQNSIQSYPPSHTVICFSAAEGRPSFQDTVEGSFYTLALSHALKQFSSKLSFHEIITQVNGGTCEIASAYNKDQNPIFKSNLEKLLVLNSECEGVWAGGGGGGGGGQSWWVK